MSTDAARAAGLPITALTSDHAFASQLRTALDGMNELTVVGDVDAAAALAVSGRCPILITDSVVTRGALEQLSSRLRTHDTASAIVVAGNRDQGGLFISLQSSGVVDGFLLKPATAAATQIVIESATRRYRRGAEGMGDCETSARARTGRRSKAVVATNDSLDSTSTIEAKRSLRPTEVAPMAISSPILPIARSPARTGPSWSLVVGLLVLIAGVAAWFIGQRPAGIDGSQIVAKHLGLAESALQSGRLLDARDGAAHHFQTALAIDPDNFAASRGLDAVASALSRQVQQHMTEGRVADAAIAIENLRAFQPRYAELPLLDSQLRSLQERVVAAHVPPAQPSEASAVKPSTPRTDAPRAMREPSKPETRPLSASTSPDSTARPIEPSATRPPSASTSALPDAEIPAVTRESRTPPAPSSAEARMASISPPPLRSTGPATDSTAAAAPSASPTPEHVPSTSTPGTQLANYVPPVYPAEALSRQMEGWIELSLEIAPSGEVLKARIEDGEKRQLFGKAALAAVKQWRYQPDATRIAGQRTKVRLEFKLE